MRKFFREFKTFITKGNVFDMAVGLIIATAFNKIVSSMVNDIIMPIVTYFTGAASLKDLSIPLRWVDGEVTLAWAYGSFLQTVIDFLIIGLSVFIMVKIMMNSRQKFKELNAALMQEASRENLKKRKEIRKQAKQEGRPFKELWKEYKVQQKLLAEQAKEEKAKQQKLIEEAERLANPTQEMLLMQIRDLLVDLKHNNNQIADLDSKDEDQKNDKGK